MSGPFCTTDRFSQDSLEINIPEVVVEVQTAHDAYENALISDDVSMLNSMFWQSAATVRYGTAERLYGYEEIAQFRRSRRILRVDQPRLLVRRVITTYGRNFATTNAEFRENPGGVVCQSQTWLRSNACWKIVSAHVSFIES